jgi:diadenosine tetraphosphate (Ap4A) HIT family hydrolase
MNAEKQRLVIPGIDNIDIGSLLFVTTYKYYCLMVKQLQEGTCPFCQIDPAVNIVLYENDSWRAWINPVAGKKHQKLHLVIPNKRHITHINEMTLRDGARLMEVFSWATAYFDLWDKGGGVVMRFGDPRFNAGTIRHLHANIQIPDGTGKLDVTFAKDPEKIEWHYQLVAVFEKLRLGTAVENLTSAERKLVEGRLD